MKIVNKVSNVKDFYRFFAYSYDTIAVSNVETSPSFFTGLDFPEDTDNFGFEINPVDGSVKNVTTLDFTNVTGTISFQPFKAGGGTTKYYLWSEHSDDDGLTWVTNEGSLRTIEIPNNGETFQSGISAQVNWTSMRIVRFKMLEIDSSGLTLQSPSQIINGETIIGASVLWQMTAHVDRYKF